MSGRRWVEVERIPAYVCTRCHQLISGTAVRMAVDWGDGRTPTASRLYDERCARLMRQDVPDSY